MHRLKSHRHRRRRNLIERPLHMRLQVGHMLLRMIGIRPWRMRMRIAEGALRRHPVRWVLVWWELMLIIRMHGSMVRMRY